MNLPMRVRRGEERDSGANHLEQSSSQREPATQNTRKVGDATADQAGDGANGIGEQATEERVPERRAQFRSFFAETGSLSTGRPSIFGIWESEYGGRSASSTRFNLHVSKMEALKS